MQKYHGIALFSGGLDSILAARLILDQGLRVLGLHFVTPFFGRPWELAEWSDWLGMPIEIVDVGQEMCDMLSARPLHGFGSVLNPCVDCKILMMRKAREYAEMHGAEFIISGEVLGQRPMSQRRDTLNVISRDGDVRDLLLRPLCARHMSPTAAELSGLLDRERLLGFSGRGRKDQLALAKAMNLPRIPAPAGGCMLTETENAARYWPLLGKKRRPDDFSLANVGRQFWRGDLWLSIGRNAADNAELQKLARPLDILLKVADFPGPLALARNLPGQDGWNDEDLAQAANLLVSYSPKASRTHAQGGKIQVRLIRNGQPGTIAAEPVRNGFFQEPQWETAREVLHALRRARGVYPFIGSDAV